MIDQRDMYVLLHSRTSQLPREAPACGLSCTTKLGPCFGTIVLAPSSSSVLRSSSISFACSKFFSAWISIFMAFSLFFCARSLTLPGSGFFPGSRASAASCRNSRRCNFANRRSLYFASRSSGVGIGGRSEIGVPNGVTMLATTWWTIVLTRRRCSSTTSPARRELLGSCTRWFVGREKYYALIRHYVLGLELRLKSIPFRSSCSIPALVHEL